MDGEAKLRGVGDSLPRLDAGDKVGGRARYTDDLFRPGMLHAALMGSPYPFARIISCDTSEALALPGVKAVLTGADIPANRWGGFINDETALTIDIVRYVGEPIAAIAATDLATAREALDLIEFEFEELDPVLTIDAAMADGAPLIHENFADYEKRPGQNSSTNNNCQQHTNVGSPIKNKTFFNQ